MFVGILGKKRHGKDTVADYITKTYPNFVKKSFAKPLKDAVQILFDFTDDQLNDENLKEEPDEFWGDSPRKVLQLVGTELFRNQYDQMFWIKVAKRHIPPNKNIIFSDVRFKNEFDFIKENKGIVIFIKRDIVQYKKDNHDSEKYIDDLAQSADYSIDNNATLNDLYNKIDDIMSKYIIKNDDNI